MEEEIENDEGLELDFAQELILEYVMYESDPADDQKVTAISVAPRSKLEQQLKDLQR